jgi:hypothetical protein
MRETMFFLRHRKTAFSKVIVWLEQLGNNEKVVFGL